MNFVYNFYRKNSKSLWVQGGIPAALALVAFVDNALKDYIGTAYMVAVGVPCIILTATHAFCVKRTSELEASTKEETINEFKKKIDEVNLKGTEAHNQYQIARHLLEVTNKLVNYKRAKISGLADTAKRFDTCINIILMMICKFYEIAPRDADLRVVFFRPSITKNGNNKYLSIYAWYNEKRIAPLSFASSERQEKVFAFDNQERKVCESWRSGRMVIVEDAEAEGLKLYENDKLYLKSMLTYPIMNPESHEVRGVVSVISNHSGFFKRADESFHRFVFEHFAMRINLEFADLEKVNS